MNSDPIANHVAKAKDRLIEQYKGKVRLEALIESIVNPLQEIEDVLNALGTNRWIDSASGVQLDKVGKIVGAYRETGQSDEDFRSIIKVQVILNLNQGTPEEIISAAQFYIGAIFIWYLEVYPAAVDIFSSTVIPLNQRARIKGQLGKFLPAGVSLDSFGQFDRTNAFQFNAGAGFGDVNNPSTGGLLADLY